MFINIFKHEEACNSIPGQLFSHTWQSFTQSYKQNCKCKNRYWKFILSNECTVASMNVSSRYWSKMNAYFALMNSKRCATRFEIVQWIHRKTLTGNQVGTGHLGQKWPELGLTNHERDRPLPPRRPGTATSCRTASSPSCSDSSGWRIPSAGCMMACRTRLRLKRRFV